MRHKTHFNMFNSLYNQFLYLLVKSQTFLKTFRIHCFDFSPVDDKDFLFLQNLGFAV